MFAYATSQTDIVSILRVYGNGCTTRWTNYCHIQLNTFKCSIICSNRRWQLANTKANTIIQSLFEHLVVPSVIQKHLACMLPKGSSLCPPSKKPSNHWALFHTSKIQLYFFHQRLRLPGGLDGWGFTNKMFLHCIHACYMFQQPPSLNICYNIR